MKKAKKDAVSTEIFLYLKMDRNCSPLLDKKASSSGSVSQGNKWHSIPNQTKLFKYLALHLTWDP